MKNIPEVDEIIQFFSEETIETMAKETKFVQRESKFTGSVFVALFTHGLLSQPDASLNQLCSMAKKWDKNLSITPEGIHQRINPNGVHLLKTLLAAALRRAVEAGEKATDSCQAQDSSQIDLDLFAAFKKVNILDSSHYSLPSEFAQVFQGCGGDASKAAMKIQLILEYKTATYRSIVITDGITPDQRYAQEVIPLLDKGELLIHDLGYFKQENMATLDQKGVYFLIRYPHQLSLLQSD